MTSKSKSAGRTKKEPARRPATRAAGTVVIKKPVPPQDQGPADSELRSRVGFFMLRDDLDQLRGKGGAMRTYKITMQDMLTEATNMWLEVRGYPPLRKLDDSK